MRFRSEECLARQTKYMQVIIDQDEYQRLLDIEAEFERLRPKRIMIFDESRRWPPKPPSIFEPESRLSLAIWCWLFIITTEFRWQYRIDAQNRHGYPKSAEQLLEETAI